MAQAFSCALRGAVFIVTATLAALPAGAETIFHRADNQVPVAIVQVTRTPGYTEIHLQTQAALAKVCWSSTGPNSPYLLAVGRRFRYLDGDNITTCPERRDYAGNEVMVLRFEPLEMQFATFSLAAGHAGESRSVGSATAAVHDWNFLRVPLK